LYAGTSHLAPQCPVRTIPPRSTNRPSCSRIACTTRGSQQVQQPSARAKKQKHRRMASVTPPTQGITRTTGARKRILFAHSWALCAGRVLLAAGRWAYDTSFGARWPSTISSRSPRIQIFRARRCPSGRSHGCFRRCVRVRDPGAHLERHAHRDRSRRGTSDVSAPRCSCFAGRGEFLPGRAVPGGARIADQGAPSTSRGVGHRSSGRDRRPARTSDWSEEPRLRNW
jgi:hypothetical protein